MEKQVFQITVQGTDARFTCAQDVMLLKAMTQAGCGPIHTGCFGGGCGYCKMRIVSGEYEIAKRMSRAHISQEEQSEGYVLICCVQPRSDLILATLEQNNA